MGVAVDATTSFSTSTPALVVAGSYYGTQGLMRGRTYDIAPDGQRFLMLKAVATINTDDPFAGLTQIVVVQNWFEELTERVPVN